MLVTEDFKCFQHFKFKTSSLKFEKPGVVFFN